MKTLALITALTLGAAPAMAGVDPSVHSSCKDAKDYQGCVKAFTTPAPETADALAPLRGAMKQVAARLQAGTSLNDSSSTFQPVVDQLALVEGTHSDSLTVQSARKASNLFNALQSAWSARIKATSYQLNQYAEPGGKFYNCKVLKLSADMFNRAYGSRVVNWDYKKGLLGTHTCRVPYGQLPEDFMRPIVNRTLTEGSISPQEIAAREKAAKEAAAARAKERELCAMGPWNRYLEENPAMKEWVKANPQLAEAKKQEILNDPARQKECGSSNTVSGKYSSGIL